MTDVANKEVTRSFRTAVLSVSALAVIILMMVPGPRTAEAGESKCVRTEFKSILIKEACAKGQKEAKAVMKDWVKSAKKKKSGLECATCHTDMAPKYDLKPEGLKLFQELGGK